jgi:hypothetical protein
MNGVAQDVRALRLVTGSACGMSTDSREAAAGFIQRDATARSPQDAGAITPVARQRGLEMRLERAEHSSTMRRDEAARMMP